MNKRLFVAGLPFSSSEKDLRDLFLAHGNVVSVQIIIDKFTGRSKGYGFVEMETDEAAAAAIQALHDSDFGGRKLIVAEAKPMEKREGGFRSDNNGGGRGFGGRDDRKGGFRGRSGGFGGRGGRPAFGQRREGGRGNFGRSNNRNSS